MNNTRAQQSPYVFSNQVKYFVITHKPNQLIFFIENFFSKEPANMAFPMIY